MNNRGFTFKSVIIFVLAFVLLIPFYLNFIKVVSSGAGSTDSETYKLFSKDFSEFIEEGEYFEDKLWLILKIFCIIAVSSAVIVAFMEIAKIFVKEDIAAYERIPAFICMLSGLIILAVFLILCFATTVEVTDGSETYRDYFMASTGWYCAWIPSVFIGMLVLSEPVLTDKKD